MPDFGDIIDQPTFDQILEMDDDDQEREFSRSIVYDFFTQAESTFNEMDQKLCVLFLRHVSYIFLSHVSCQYENSADAISIELAIRSAVINNNEKD